MLNYQRVWWWNYPCFETFNSSGHWSYTASRRKWVIPQFLGGMGFSIISYKHLYINHIKPYHIYIYVYIYIYISHQYFTIIYHNHVYSHHFCIFLNDMCPPRETQERKSWNRPWRAGKRTFNTRRYEGRFGRLWPFSRRYDGWNQVS